MKIHMNFQCQTILILGISLASAAGNFEIKHPKAWSIPSDIDSDVLRTIDENISSGSVKIQPSSFSDQNVPKISRNSKIAHEFKDYVFRPRTVPLNKEPSQDQSNIYYSDIKVGETPKSEYLFPGNYIPISEVKRKGNATDDTTYNPLSAGTFKPLTIPLIRDQEAMKRSLNEGEEIVTEKSTELTGDSVLGRSISYIFGADDNEDDDGGDETDYETDEEENTSQNKGSGIKGGKKKRKRKIKATKYSKYMMPLLLAYKLKYFALAPVLVSGLVLLVGATGLAGFFFALFAAVMGLQKGGDY